MKKVLELEVRNLKGIEHLHLKVGNVVVIEGENGAGKSSVLDALRTVFEGGQDPGLIRRGAKKAEVRMLLSDGVTIRKSITSKASDLTISDPNGGVVRSPKAYVEQLASGFAFDPLALMVAKPKDRAAFLLDAMPISFTAAEVREAAGYKVHSESVDLEGLMAIHQAIYEERTQQNRLERDAAGTVSELRKTLSEDPNAGATDWSQVEADAQTRLQELQEAFEAEEARQHQECEDKVERERQEAEAEIARVRERLQQRITSIREASEKERSATRTEYEGVKTPLIQHASEARMKAEQAVKDATIREHIERTQQKADQCARRSQELTEALANLQALRDSRLEQLPLPGVVAREGEIYVDDVPFAHLNTAKQIELVYSLAQLKTGELPLMIVDGAERLDAETYQGFLEAAKSSGMQVIVARVGDGPLAVSAG